MRCVIIWLPGWASSDLVTGVDGEKPVAVISKGRIRYANARAKRAGVTETMNLALAMHLCDQLVTITEDPQQSQRSFEQVLQALHQVSARVYALRPGIAWIPLRGLERHYRSDAQLCEALTDAVATHTGCECVVAAGDSLLQAWVEALADVGISTHHHQSDFRRDTADSGNPWWDNPGDSVTPELSVESSSSRKQRHLDHCQLAVLTELCAGNREAVERVITDLAQLGIYTVGQAQRFGLAHIAGRFGHAGATLARLLAGENPLPTVTELPVIRIRAAVEFTPAAPQIDHIIGQVLTVCNDLVQQCFHHQVCPRTLEITATFEASHAEAEGAPPQCRRLWALTDLPNSHDLVQRVRWQLQGWLEQSQLSRDRVAQGNQLQPGRSRPGSQSLQGDRSRLESDPDNRGGAALKTLNLQASDLVSLQDASESLWGKNFANDARAQHCLYRIQSLLGADQVETVDVHPGFDPLTRIQRRPWASVPKPQPWQNWKVPARWENDSHYAPEQRWHGGIGGLSPPTVFADDIVVQLRDQRNLPVKVDSALMLTPEPHTLVLPLQLAVTLPRQSLTLLEEVGLKPGAVTTVAQLYRIWPITGRWWQVPPEPARLWVSLSVSSSPPLLLDYENQEWFLRAVWY